MKKLITAVIAMSLGVVVSAASMDWGATYTYASLGKGEAGIDRGTTSAYIAYVFDTSVYSYSDAQTAFAKGDAATLIDNAIGSKGIDADDLGGFLGNSDFAGKGGDTISAYTVIFDAADVASAEYMYLSEVQSAEIPTSGVAGAFTFGVEGDMVGMANASNWTAVGAPEPTSGLLLLLGMAGLALKRKRA